MRSAWMHGLWLRKTGSVARYTFSEWCEEVPDLPLEDGTRKIFLNMASKNRSPELISLLQYMKNPTMDNGEIFVEDERILEPDRIVKEVKQSEEWEEVRMNILEIGTEKGMEIGIARGREEMILSMLQNGETYSKVA